MLKSKYFTFFALISLLVLMPFCFFGDIRAQEDYIDPGNGSSDSNSVSEAAFTQMANDLAANPSEVQQLSDAFNAAGYGTPDNFQSALDTWNATNNLDHPSVDPVSNSSESSNVSQAFTETVQSLAGMAGLSNLSPGFLSNQNHTLQRDDVISFNAPDPGDTGCANAACGVPAPQLTAALCINNQMAVRLNWTQMSPSDGTYGLVRLYHIVREPHFNDPSYYNERIRWYTEPNFTDTTIQPSSVYYYRVYGSNASADWNSTTGLFDSRYTMRTPVSNVVAVVTPSYCGAPKPSPSVSTPPAPSPTPPPVATPTPAPGAFTLSAPETFCSGTNSHIRLSWTAASSGPSASTNSGYFVYVDGVYQYNALHALNLSDPAARNIGQTYRYRVEAVTPSGRTFSNEQTVTARECRSPSINLTVTTPRGTFPYGGLPVAVKQGDTVTVNWNVQYADWTSTFANPGRSDWAGARGSSGSQSISTTTEGNYVLGLSAGNIVSTTSVSLQLNILRLPAYIQTTGGDVHTNEDIFITPNN